MAECVFCAVVAGSVSAAKVHETDEVCCFLDHRPLFPGHVLVVPKLHVETLQDLPPERLAGLFGAARLIGAAQERALGCQGTFVAVNNRVSQSVPHLHVHVVPRTKGDGLKGFFWPRTPYRDAAHLEDVRSRIAAAAAECFR